MSNGQKLSIGEFLADLRGVVTSPGSRFQAIHERGAMWGSLLLMLVPIYFALSYVGGVYFDGDPFPGYSFIPPAICAAVLTWLKLFGIHIVARLFEGKWHYRAGKGRLRDLTVVFGYTGLPSIIALLLALVVFLSFPDQIAGMFRNFRIAATSVLVAVGIALFIWNLILMVLALRTVYPVRDYKLVISVLLGPFLAGIPAVGTSLVTAPAHIEYRLLTPILNPKVTRFVSADPESQEPKRSKISIHVDLLVYQIKDPKRFELVSFTPKPADKSAVAQREKGHSIWRAIRSHLWMSDIMHEQLCGRIVGLPGDEVELVQGRLRVNGRFWRENYILPEFQCDSALPPVKLGPSDYLILPEDRRQIDAYRDQWTVPRDRITGRLTLTKLPLGWFLFRPTAFFKADQQN